MANPWADLSRQQRQSAVLSGILAGTTQKDMAAQYGVSQSLISKVARAGAHSTGLIGQMPWLLHAPRSNNSRFWDFVVPEPNSGCWIFVGADNGNGYGTFRSRSNPGKHYAHRIAYEELIGAVPSDMELDHLCQTRCCCNPDHLEPVTREENMRRAARAKAEAR